MEFALDDQPIADGQRPESLSRAIEEAKALEDGKLIRASTMAERLNISRRALGESVLAKGKKEIAPYTCIVRTGSARVRVFGNERTVAAWRAQAGK